MYEHDKQMLTEIEEDFQNGLKVSDRGYLNLDDEQVLWMIQTIKHYDNEVNHLNDWIKWQHEGTMNLLEQYRNMKRMLNKIIIEMGSNPDLDFRLWDEVKNYIDSVKDSL